MVLPFRLRRRKQRVDLQLSDDSLKGVLSGMAELEAWNKIPDGTLIDRLQFASPLCSPIRTFPHFHSLYWPSCLFRSNRHCLTWPICICRNRIITGLYQETAVAKQAQVADYVDSLCKSGEKFLVFAYHKSMFRALETAVVKAKVCGDCGTVVV